MKGPTVAMFSLVVAYSAYQSTGSFKPGSAQQGSGTSHDSAQAAATARSTSPSAREPFPALSGGICQLAVNGDATPPCGDCQAICPARELRALLEDYFRAESGSDKEYLAAHWNVPQAKKSNIKFVIASLPNPVHTHMALLFDRGIETIQSAAQADGYLFSRAWMPWDISTHSESTDFTVRMAQAKFKDQVESLPGLMIFQGPGGDAPMKMLFVFVVGETPTGGLRIEQFQNALNIRQSILADANPGPKVTETDSEAKVLRIDGPAFSGSLSSLNAILNAQPHGQFSKILIRSGTISSFRAVSDFCESTQREWPEKDVPQNGRPDFATFEFSDKHQEFYLSVFLSKRYHAHSNVAILSEDETKFGNQDPKDAELSRSQKPSGVCPSEPPPPVIPFVRLYFPREIAQLRDAYQRDLKSQSAADTAKNPPQNGLAMSFGATGNDDDSVAAYSPLQTPLSQESILQAIVATLRKDHARIVVVRGTDPLDVVFLSRYLRQNYPQGRLVTVGADLLMIHDLFDPRFHGILALSSYPLLTGAEFPQMRATGKQEVHRLFPDSYSVGNFNAFQSLLADDATTTDSRKLPRADYAQFGLPSFLQPKHAAHKDAPWRAHLWLTTVGRESYWPVAVLDDVSQNELNRFESRPIKPEPSIRPIATQMDQPPSIYSVHFSVGWTVFWIPAFGVTILLALLLAFPSTFSRSETLGRWVGKVLRPVTVWFSLEACYCWPVKRYSSFQRSSGLGTSDDQTKAWVGGCWTVWGSLWFATLSAWDYWASRFIGASTDANPPRFHEPALSCAAAPSS